MRVKNRVAQNEVVELAPVVAARASGAPAPAAAAAASAAGPSGRAGEGSKSALKAEMTLLFTENRRAFAENVSLRSENAALRAALKEAQRSARAAQREECAPAEGADHQLWEQREHQLVSEFSTLIDSLKCEIARQNEYIATLRQPSNALKQVRRSSRTLQVPTTSFAPSLSPLRPPLRAPWLPRGLCVIVLTRTRAPASLSSCFSPHRARAGVRIAALYSRDPRLYLAAPWKRSR